MKILKRNQIIISVLALMLITVGYMTYTSNVTDALETGALMDSETMAGIGDAKLVNSNDVAEGESQSTTEANNSALVPNTESSDNKENTTDNSKNNTTNTTKTAESTINSDKENVSNITSASSTSTNNATDSTSTKSSNTSTKNEKNATSTNSNKNSSTNNKTDASSKTTSSSTYETDYFVTSKLERDKMYSQMLETYQGLVESSTISPEQKNISTQEIANINNRKNSIMIAENLVKNLGFEDVVIFVNDNSTSVVVKAEKLSEADIAQIQNVVCREIGVAVEEIHISLK